MSHTLAYSLIGLQELNLAYKYPIEYWNCACLISNSGGNEKEDSDEEEYNELIYEDDYTDDIENFYEDVEDDDDDDDEENKKPDKKKKKSQNTNYGKVASAIGKMTSEGIKILPPNINTSSYTFSPDPQNHIIRFGLSGITKVGKDLIQLIIKNRPYQSIEDFLNKVKVTKPQMINLIKSGAFDEFGERKDIMYNYIKLISEPKKRITL